MLRNLFILLLQVISCLSINVPASPPSVSWRAVSSNGDGSFLVAATDNDGILLSPDYGKSWSRYSSVPLSFSWNSISLSNDGKILSVTAGKNGFHFSNDGGMTWKIVNLTPPGASVNWQDVKMSYSGQFQLICSENGQIYRSHDYGMNWNAVLNSSFSGNCSSVALDGSGKYMSIAGQQKEIDGGNGEIVQSVNFGGIWFSVAVDEGKEKKGWNDIVCDETGQYWVASNEESGIIRSEDSGNEWLKTAKVPVVSNDTIVHWKELAMDSSGRYVAALISGVNYTTIYVSSDYGKTWNESNPIQREDTNSSGTKISPRASVTAFDKEKEWLTIHYTKNGTLYAFSAGKVGGNDTSGEVSSSPTMNPTTTSSFFPSFFTGLPTKASTVNPTANPTVLATSNPSSNPTAHPTAHPTGHPTASVTSAKPSTNEPSVNPTVNPTVQTTAASSHPSFHPTVVATSNPTELPTDHPTEHPTELPSEHPTSVKPSANPTFNPTTADISTGHPTSSSEKCAPYCPTFPTVNTASAAPQGFDANGEVYIDDDVHIHHHHHVGHYPDQSHQHHSSHDGSDSGGAGATSAAELHRRRLNHLLSRQISYPHQHTSSSSHNNNNNNVIHHITTNEDNDNGIYVSFNHGLTWKKVSNVDFTKELPASRRRLQGEEVESMASFRETTDETVTTAAEIAAGLVEEEQEPTELEAQDMTSSMEDIIPELTTTTPVHKQDVFAMSRLRANFIINHIAFYKFTPMMEVILTDTLKNITIPTPSVATVTEWKAYLESDYHQHQQQQQQQAKKVMKVRKLIHSGHDSLGDEPALIEMEDIVVEELKDNEILEKNTIPSSILASSTSTDGYTYYNFIISTSLVYYMMDYPEYNSSVLIDIVKESIQNAVDNGLLTEMFHHKSRDRGQSLTYKSTITEVEFLGNETISLPSTSNPTVSTSGTTLTRDQIALYIIWVLLGGFILFGIAYYYFFIYKRMEHPNNQVAPTMLKPKIVASVNDIRIPKPVRPASPKMSVIW
jgi:hypothetical protein